MSKYFIARSHESATTLLRFLCLLLFAAAVITDGTAQQTTTNATKGYTPSGVTPGSPAGSYPLSGFDTINPYNGGLNFNLPLRGVGGRGEVGYTIPLQIEQKWTATHDRIIDPQTNQQWDFWWPEYNRWNNSPGYNPGILLGRQVGLETRSCSYVDYTWYTYYWTLTRLTFITPDGTEYELRDQLTGGQQATVPPCTPLGTPGFSRGTVFVTADGSAATFISDEPIRDEIGIGTSGIIAPSGYLMLRDGTRYRITYGNVKWMRDRNGNTLTVGDYSGGGVPAISDSTGRRTILDYEHEGQYGNCDKIIFKGFGGAERLIRVCRNNLGNALREGYELQTPRSLFPELVSGSTEWQHDPLVTSVVWLPDTDGVTRKYQFRYNSYGELARVELPTGGAFEYDWAAGITDGPVSGAMYGNTDFPQIYRRVVERREYPDGGTGSSYAMKMTYSRPESMSSGNPGYVDLSQYNNAGVLLARTRHYYNGSPIQSMLDGSINPLSYSNWLEGREYRTETFDADGETVLRKVDHNWQQGVAVSPWAPDIANNPRIADTTTTLEPAGANLVSKQIFSYDDSVPFNNRSDVYEYDFGVGGPGGLLRRSHTDYVTSSAYVDGNIDPSLGPHLRQLTSGAWVSSDGTDTNKVSLSAVEYDNYSSDSFHAALEPRPNISGLCTLVTSPTQCDNTNPSGYLKRGNVTAATSYLLTNGAATSSISSHHQYDVAGNVIKTLDPRSTPTSIIATTFDFSDRFGSPDGDARANSGPIELGGLSSYAFVTKTTNALGHIIYTQFDYYLGQPVNGEDANGVVSSSFYNDVFDRPKQSKRAVGTALENQTNIDYNDVGRVTTITSDLNSNNDNVLKSQTLYDGFGRTTETRQYEGGANYIAKRQQYDALGRPYLTSNPFRPWQSEVALWTTTAFDALGRITTVTAPDGSQVSTEYPLSASGLVGTGVTVTDQAGKKRRSVSDVLGRLLRVDEPDSSNDLGPINSPLQPTSYGYDSLDNLVNVWQGTQTRTFVYDSLKRLTSATNPESGTICYGTVTAGQCEANGYDASGNLTKKTDARLILSTYAYDALNRNITVDYSDTPGITPDITRIYDTAANGLGRLQESYAGGDATAGSTVEHSKIQSYDVLGRPLDLRQRFKTASVWSAEYQTQRSYNFANAVTSQIYPSGNTVAYAYDSAGRLNSFTGDLADVSRSYSTAITYSPLGGITKEQFGTDTVIYNKSFYNSRGQLSEIRVSTSYTGPTDTTWNRGAIINHYSNSCWGMCGGNNSSTSMTDNNGNLRKQDVYVPLNDQLDNAPYTMWWQGYDYDSLNRLQRVHEYTGTQSLDWQQEYVYDRYGNRTLHQANTWGTGINKKDFTSNLGNNNRLGVPAGQTGTMAYDDAGNLTTDTYSAAAVTRTYDAENRMTSEMQANNSEAGVYTYNADGQRVRRKVNGVETWQVYGMDGELLAEYSALNPGILSPQKEYGYRNGQLLITATAGSSWNSAPTFVNNPLVAGQTDVKALHITQLREAINDLRGHMSFPDYTWVYSATTNDYISANPILEMRTALDQALGAPSPAYAAGLASGQPIKAIHIQELRTRVLDAWSTGNPLEINWLVTDQLGTARMIFNQTGSLAKTKRHDYLPFGEELSAGQGLRTDGASGLGYTADTTRQKFTSKERDIETGLDYFLARYYSSKQGRFTSPDEFSGGPDELYDFAEDAAENPTFYAELDNPQSLNKYQYTYNDPLNMVDPDGHCPPCLGPSMNVREGLEFISDPSRALDKLQLKISVIGLAPGGDVAEIANIVISGVRGNYAEALTDTGAVLTGPALSTVAVANRGRKIARLAARADNLVEAGAEASVGVSKPVRPGSLQATGQLGGRGGSGKAREHFVQHNSKKPGRESSGNGRKDPPHRTRTSRGQRPHFHQRGPAGSNVHHTFGRAKNRLRPGEVQRKRPIRQNQQ